MWLLGAANKDTEHRTLQMGYKFSALGPIFTRRCFIQPTMRLVTEVVFNPVYECFDAHSALTNTSAYTARVRERPATDGVVGTEARRATLQRARFGSFKYSRFWTTAAARFLRFHRPSTPRIPTTSLRITPFLLPLWSDATRFSRRVLRSQIRGRGQLGRNCRPIWFELSSAVGVIAARSLISWS